MIGSKGTWVLLLALSAGAICMPIESGLPSGVSRKLFA